MTDGSQGSEGGGAPAGPVASVEQGGRRARDFGVGCVTALAGFFSGAMFAVLIAKIVGGMRGCPPMEHGAPCDWHIYAGVGALIGMITLPAFALRRLRAADRPRDTDRG